MGRWLGKKRKNKDNPSKEMHEKIKLQEAKQKFKGLNQEVCTRISKSLKLEILFVVIVSLGISTVAFFLVRGAINRTDIGRYKYYDYEESRRNAEGKLLNVIRDINYIESEENNFYEALDEPSVLENILEIIKMVPKQDALVNLEAYAMGLVSEGHVSAELTTQSTNLEELYTNLVKIQQEGALTYSSMKQELLSYYEKQGISTKTVNEQRIRDNISNMANNINGTLYLIDGQGKLVYQEGFVEALDIIKVIQKVNQSTSYASDESFTAIYPVIIGGQIYYLFCDTTLSPITSFHYTGVGNLVGLVTAMGLFIAVLFRFTKPKIDYIEYLSHCLEEISKGDLAYKVDRVGEDELAEVAKNITYMESEIKLQIEEKAKSEQAKNELITNVAHDLRTPLTSIIGYIGLVKNKQFSSEEDEAKYLDIAYTKSEKLKVLIEDLFELTKLHQGQVKIQKEVISVTNLINQLVEEIMPLATEKNIDIQAIIAPKEASIRADIPKITRVFENLIENAIKYSSEGDAIYVQLKELPKEVNVIVSNRCYDISKEEVDRFFDRFYRADKSRNSTIGGSGLGLAIAKNIVELHGGKITAKLEGDLISFKVRLPKYKIVEKA